MGESRNILIVDDNESISKTMSFVFNRRGFVATTAKNGREAVERALGEDFEIILMDIKMPEQIGRAHV
jgi:CheY-like chemotaxis protein